MLPLDQRKLFYDAIVKQIKQYASIMWTSCSENIRKVFRLQKHAAHVILSADTKENSIQLFKQLGRVPFYGEAKINKSILVYKRISGDCSSCMNQILIRNKDFNEQKSRHGQLNLVYPRFKRESEGEREVLHSIDNPPLE